MAPGIRLMYLVAALSMSTAYMFGAIILSLGATIAEQITHATNVLEVGAIMAVMSVFIGATALATRAVRPRNSISIGAVVTLAAFALLLDAAYTGSLPVFVATTIVAGSGYALMFSGALALIGQNAPAHHRAGTISAVYLVAYLMQGATAVALGFIATGGGLRSALDVGAIGVGVFAIGSLVTAQVLRARQNAAESRTAATAHTASIAFEE